MGVGICLLPFCCAPGQVNVFIEMAKLLEEKYPEIYDRIYDEAICNLDIRERKSHSRYLKV